MTPEKFESLKEYVVSQLNAHLLPGLYYHSTAHTLDVLKAIETIADAEKVSQSEMLLLKVAALFHDSGYLFTANNHEANSCRIARSILPGYEFSDAEIELICGLIMATKIPHKPENKLQEIICDADLDYLGRDDFQELSQNLFKEMMLFGKVKNETDWNIMQANFFESHKYFTVTSNKLRASIKEKNFESIKSLLLQNKKSY